MSNISVVDSEEAASSKRDSLTSSDKGEVGEVVSHKARYKSPRAEGRHRGKKDKGKGKDKEKGENNDTDKDKGPLLLLLILLYCSS